MRSFRRIALSIAIVALGLLTAGGLPGESRAATSLDGTWSGWDHPVKISGTLEGGFSISVGESYMSFGCPISAGSHLSSFSPSGGGSYDETDTIYWSSSDGVPPDPVCTTEEKSSTGTTVTGDSNSLEISTWPSLSRVSSPTTTTPTTPTTTTPTTPTTTTTPTTPTTTKPKLVGKLVVTLFEMPDRYGTDADHNGLVDALTTPEQVNPAEWTAKLWVRRPHADCDPGASYSWQVDGRIAKLERTRTKCVFTYTHFKKLGPHRVKVAATKNGRQREGSNTVTLKDLLIVGLGDSNGSGEGNPDNPGFGVSWIDPRCDRSHYSYQAQTARTLEQASDDTSVTFVHLACSGASIIDGLLGGYGGINDPGGNPLLPQVIDLKHLIEARTSDKVPARPVNALILSIGVNDLHFGDIVTQCVWQTVCWNSTDLPGAQPNETVDQALERWLGVLPASYSRLARVFTTMKIPPGRIYITQYFDSLRNEDEAICNPLIGATQQGLAFTKSEARWAYSSFMVPLNKIIAARARWNVVPAPASFRTHGYCAKDSWIVPISSSYWNQWASAGTMHANLDGHQAQRRAVVAALKHDGIDGKP